MPSDFSMPSDFIIGLLKRWRAGKKLAKHQYAELVNDGYLTEDSPNLHSLTNKGFDLLKTHQ